jgi:hypothetical protein
MTTWDVVVVGGAILGLANAPSPAATALPSIGRQLARCVPERLDA